MYACVYCESQYQRVGGASCVSVLPCLRLCVTSLYMLRGGAHDLVHGDIFAVQLAASILDT